jgi:hypothetical protein
MATTVMPNTAAPKLRPGRRYDNRFVSFMVLLLLATVLYGFARSYFLAGVFRAPLPNTLIHIHGAVFTSWMLLLITQTSLVSAGRVDIHRKLGLAGFGLACLMIILGVLAATDALARNFIPPGAPFDAKTFYTVPMGDMLIFAALIFFAYRFRSNPAVHKRLILIASISLMDAPLGRVPFLNQSHLISDIACYSFFVLLFAYDWWSTGKIQRVTIWATLFVIIVEELRVPIGMTAPWHAFATWMQIHHF